MYMRKIMVGKMFAGGRVSSFHLTLLARHSVRRPRPLRENSELICESRGSPQLTRWGATRRRHLLPAPTGSADSSGRSTIENTLSNTIEMVFVPDCGRVEQASQPA